MGNQFKNVAIIACLKTFLFVFNIVFWLTGIALLGVGIWAELELYKYLELSPDFAGSGPLVIIGIGGLIIIISSIAFSCIIKGQPVLLNVYGGFLACIFMMMAGVGFSMACHRDSFNTGLRAGLTKTLNNYSPEKINFDNVQEGLKCCGVSNYTDWVVQSRVIPPSCCIDKDQCTTSNYNHVFQQGCYKALTEFMETNTDILIGIAIGAAVFPLLGTIMAWSLAGFIKASHYDVMN